MPVLPDRDEYAYYFTLGQAPLPVLDMGGLLGYQTLRTAEELGLFAALAYEACSTAELATKLSLDPDGLQLLLDALEGLHYVERQDANVSLTRWARIWLLDEARFPFQATRTFLEAARQTVWPTAAAILRGEARPIDFYSWLNENPAISSAFQQMMIANTQTIAPAVAALLPVPSGAKKVLDVGGGHGLFSMALCQLYDGLNVTILDSETALTEAQRLAAAHGLTERTTFQPGDLFESDWGNNYDLILIFNVIHGFSDEAIAQLMQRVYAALRPGGVAIVQEQQPVPATGEAAETIARLMRLQFHLFTPTRRFTLDSLGHYLSDANLVDISFPQLTGAPGLLFASGTKPDRT